MNEKKIILFIRYIPALFIILFSILITYFISEFHQKNLKIDKDEIRKQYILDEKSRIKDNIDSVFSYIEYEKSTAIKSLKTQLKTQVYMASEIVNSIYKDNKNNKSKEEILFQIKSALKNVRFNEGRGYFFLYTSEGVNLFHPTNPELEGSRFFKDKELLKKYGLNNLTEFSKIKTEGFLFWNFIKPNSTSQEYKKLGFTKKFEPYDCFIATGEYLDEFIESVQKKVIANLRSLKYKNNEYLYVTDMRGVVLATKNHMIEGKNVFEINKSPALKTNLESFFSSKRESMFLEYELENKDKQKTKRISYIKKILGYDWVIGTGFSLASIDEIMNKRDKQIEESYNNNLNNIFGYFILITILLLVISYIFSKKIEKIFLDNKKELLAHEKEKSQIMLKELRKILDSLPMMLAYKDTKNNIITVNKSSADALNLEVEDLTRISVKKIFPKDYRRYYSYDLEVIKTKKAKLGLIEKQIINGKEKIVEGSIVPILNKKNEVENIIVFMIDITEKKNLEKENEKKEKLLYQQNKLATMGEMIGNIAHQWRQPLSAISTAATGIKIEKEMGMLKDSDFYTSMDSINESVQYLSQTIEDFRGFFIPSKNATNEFLISHSIDKTIKLINASFVSKNIKIIKMIEDKKIISLENELIQVLLNLFNNSKDALLTTRDNDRLVFISAFEKDGYLHIETKDNGYGIKEEILDRIFEPYFTTKHKSQGTGIGLYMSYEMVQKLFNGEMKVENETFFYEKKEYLGAKFTITIKL